MKSVPTPTVAKRSDLNDRVLSMVLYLQDFRASSIMGRVQGVVATKLIVQEEDEFNHLVAGADSSIIKCDRRFLKTSCQRQLQSHAGSPLSGIHFRD